MSYSYELQAAVYDRMTELEKQQAPAQTFPQMGLEDRQSENPWARDNFGHIGHIGPTI